MSLPQRVCALASAFGTNAHIAAARHSASLAPSTDDTNSFNINNYSYTPVCAALG